MPRNNLNDYASADVRQTLQNMKATGSNTVSLVVPWYQKSYRSTEIFRGANTPSDSALAQVIDYAHSIGLKVLIKFHVEAYDMDWRANINPRENRGRWFDSYGDALVHTAKIAQDHNAEMISIGTEMGSMTLDRYHEKNTERWIQLINRTRAVYSGKLTYNAHGNGDEDTALKFWPQLDYITTSAYYDLTSQNAAPATVDQLKAAWVHWDNSEIKALATKYNKQVIFGEIGYRSIRNSTWQPWNYVRDSGGPVDQSSQAMAYEALISYWDPKSYFAGVMFWDWHSNPYAGGPNSVAFTPQNKQAEQVMKRMFNGVTPPPPPPPTGSTLSASWNDNAGHSVALAGDNNASTYYLACTSPDGKYNNGTVTYDLGAVKDIKNISLDFNQWDAVYPGAPASVYVLEVSDNNLIFLSQAHQVSGDGRVADLNLPLEARGRYVRLRHTKVNDGTGWCLALNEFKVSTETVTSPPPTTATVQVWWPSNSATVTGVQPFKVIAENMTLNQYTMYWQVDGGALNPMYDSQQDYPHKEAMVDVSGWNWRGSGPYTINFVVKDLNGVTIGQKSVTVTVG